MGGVARQWSRGEGRTCAPPPVTSCFVGRNKGKLGRSLLSVSLEGRRGKWAAWRAVSTRFRGGKLEKFCGPFTGNEAVPQNFVKFPCFNSEASPNDGN